jgi:hypothetical protein
MPVYSSPERAADPLTVLLLRAAPENERGHPTLTGLADALGVSRWSIQKWIINQKISPDRVMQVVRIGEGRVKREEFEPFVYKE